MVTKTTLRGSVVSELVTLEYDIRYLFFILHHIGGQWTAMSSSEKLFKDGSIVYLHYLVVPS